MFDAERILGTLISGALTPRHRRRSRSSLDRLSHGAGTAIGMGLLGVAMSAYEHYTTASQQTAASGAAPFPPQPPAAPMPPAAIPPPPPRVATGQSQTTNVSGAAPSSDQLAMLLIRAMIAAAHADWSMDDDERSNILDALGKSQLNAEEQACIEHELDNPLGLEELASQVTSREVAEQMYSASLLAIDVNADAERGYLKRLAQKLNLDEQWVSRIHQELGED